MDLKRSLGLLADGSNVPNDQAERAQLLRYINIKLAAVGARNAAADSDFMEVAQDLLAHYREFSRLLDNYLCPIDQRIQNFLDEHLAGISLNGLIRLPSLTLVADRHGIARELSLPQNSNHFKSERLDSYRTWRGVLHNPKSDRRTTEGVFHVAQGGLPIPSDKLSVPLNVYGNLLHAALNPPSDLLQLPFTAETENPTEIFVSLLLRPVVVPEVPGISPRKSMEVRFFAPGSLVSNLDFVETIFGNAGDPLLPENDSALDVEHWTGHTGCIILAPHITECKKKDLGLPHFDDATELQRAQGMCWKDADEKYNGGKPFKITCRTSAGLMVTILGDNYFGYSKKEVKTQISFSANLFGLAEEEHAGGALAFASYLLGEQFRADSRVETAGQTFADTIKLLGDSMFVNPQGYGIDQTYPSIVYVPHNVHFDLPTQQVSWNLNGRDHSIKLLAGNVYVLPSGYKVRMEKHPGAPSWRLVGTVAEGTFCHKPCTVSGGGKSEISKSIVGSLVYGPIYTADLQKDLEFVEKVFAYDYSLRFPAETRHDYTQRKSRSILSPQRSLGSVIKLLTPSPEYTPEFNKWLEEIPDHIRPIVFIIKRFHRPEWGDDWRQNFSVDEVNGAPGHQLKFGERKLVGTYLRVGFTPQQGWRLHKLRQDFIAADKVQMEDDITASVTVPANRLSNLPADLKNPGVKLTENCEWRLFQRPDDAIHRGMDEQAEYDMAQPGLFASNYEPITSAQARDIVENIVTFEEFTEPMQAKIIAAAQEENGYVVSSANPRIVNGKPSKNPRYLQTRPDVSRPRDGYLAHVGTRLFRQVPTGKKIVFPVTAVLCGRRNNPAEPGVRPLAVYNPIHYQELPELFMDFVCSLTGKSPSTTGAGSEGALTKSPFNALLPAPDLNNALVSYILTGYAGFTTAAGYVGPHVRVDHDISLLIPEVWARLPLFQQDPKWLIANHYLEKLADFTHNGKRVLASRLGYRITEKFVHDFFGKVFDNPAGVFNSQILRPETQDIEAFVDGVDNIVTAQQRVAAGYFIDGSLESCCPPLQAVIRIMNEGTDADPAAIDESSLRQMFTREHLLQSDWYQARLRTKQTREVELWTRHVASLEAFQSRASHRDVIDSLNIAQRLKLATQQLANVRSEEYLNDLRGTLGADLLGKVLDNSPAHPSQQREPVGA